ncbi:MAG: sulfotransferase [bacterium]|nr:sulfotransferase [bacterium]
MNRRPILITGAHRSGTTWVGQMIGKSHQVCYIFEPFNKEFGPGICRTAFHTWYPYVTSENADQYHHCLSRVLHFKFHFWKELRAIRTKAQVRLLGENLTRFNTARRKKQRALFKDPIAFFSAPWLAQTFDFQVIVLIRHPAAFAASLKRLNWQFPFNDFLKQPLLMAGPLQPFQAEIEAAARRQPDIIHQAALLWKLIYSQVPQYRQKHPDWIFIKHEDISADPSEKFRFLYERLDLEFTPAVENHIREYSGGAHPAQIPDRKATVLKRNSKENIYSWKKRVTDGEAERIKRITGETAGHFYPDSEW